MLEYIKQLNNPKNKRAAWFVGCLILLGELVLCALIIWKVPYTEIDWIAYMQEVGGFLDGERNYLNLKGDTGPLVYPAGFVYLYSGLYYLTQGGNIFLGQIVFYFLYVITQAIVLYLYIESELVPPWGLGLLALSKRLHSIYILRLFNDCWSSFFAYVATAFVINQKWRLAILIFSLGVSIKMNVLLFTPPVVFVALHDANFLDIFLGGLAGVLLQGVLAVPFLTTYPQEYIQRAFEFGRVFMYKWTVNFKFIDKQIFVSKELALGLLVAHLSLLVIFLVWKWMPKGDTFLGLFQRLFFKNEKQKRFSKQQTLYILFSGNFIGILCARSLHYQFYSWYYHTIPFLLWSTPFYLPFKLLLWILIEIVWNIYPATAQSSLLLLLCHVTLLVGLWLWQPEKQKQKVG
eukprot:TRINITY_DN1957_c1_g1_i6.p2 TRINITY_DN1957_c1_g1~~TRINITY_DN1957_c1_g1_i6.p2  ORF type:complete len:404 (+),score=32.81 TRINITY_DN1957_c1_g1_i6:178-1389(+)